MLLDILGSSRPKDRYLKNDEWKSIGHLIKRADFHLYREYTVGVIWTNQQMMTNIYEKTSSNFYASNLKFTPLQVYYNHCLVLRLL